MSAIEEALRRHGSKPALQCPAGGQLSYAELAREVAALRSWLRRRSPRSVALMADNGAAWVAVDLACLTAGVPLTPLPSFFSNGQVRHALEQSGADLLLTPDQTGDDTGEVVDVCGTQLRAHALPGGPALDCAKLTFTSGTTGAPKGVRLSRSTLERTGTSLSQSLAPLGIERHLAVLPLSTLLENIAGVYVPLLRGATLVLPSLQALGYTGASGLVPDRFVAEIQKWAPHSLILVPQLLDVLIGAAEAGARFPSLRFVAVGGGKLAAGRVAYARERGLPVYEGYGLSECASVVALNLPGADRPGSVGRPLPHVGVAIAEDDEILVEGTGYSGYAGEAPRSAAPVATGDLGRFDADGFLYVTGRKKNLFITAYGRNVTPEWVEAELVAQPEIAQACVFGEARPWNTAVIVSAADDAAIAAALGRANTRLPDYARVSAWIRAPEPFAVENQLLTANGRLRRQAIWDNYAAAVERLYQKRSSS